MKEIEKIKDKDKINYHQCKISIVLPKKQSGKSYHNSYHNSASKKKKKTEYPSDKKNYPSNKRKSKVIGS